MSEPAGGGKAPALGIAAGAVAIVCCAAGPALAAIAGSLAVGAWLGTGAALLALIAGVTTVYLQRRAGARKHGPLR